MQMQRRGRGREPQESEEKGEGNKMEISNNKERRVTKEKILKKEE